MYATATQLNLNMMSIIASMLIKKHVPGYSRPYLSEPFMKCEIPIPTDTSNAANENGTGIFTFDTDMHFLSPVFVQVRNGQSLIQVDLYKKVPS